ncbi:MAG: hypothetical protein NWS46_05680 [Cyclobacteriaceae bacterium]|nr:hypothetical protein [Cyclobacteriaceae bacterium]
MDNKNQKNDINSLDRLKPLKSRVGILGVGHHTYWSQFEGLLDQMHDKLRIFETKVQFTGVEIHNFGISDNAESASEILFKIKAANLDLLFVDMLTYATSSTIACIFRSADIPIVLVALQPDEALDYENATTHLQLLNDDICALPEFISVAIRMGKPVPPLVIGTLHNDPHSEFQIREFCQIAHVLHSLKTARIGQMGHVLEAMYDLHTDSTLLMSAFGCHIVQTEVDDIYKHYKKTTDLQVQVETDEILSFFDIPDPKVDPITKKLSEEDLYEAAKVSGALKSFVSEKNLDGLAYYYEAEEGSEIRKIVSNLIVGNSILTGKGFPMCGEMDLKTCIAMMIMDRLEMGRIRTGRS